MDNVYIVYVFDYICNVEVFIMLKCSYFSNVHIFHNSNNVHNDNNVYYVNNDHNVH